MNQDLIIEAIKLRKPLEFEYNKPEKVVGKRFGNPHSIFVHPGTNRIDIDIFQTGGVSDTELTNGLPWRRFSMEFMHNVRVMYEMDIFEIAEGYNSNSYLYIKSIFKI